jgi:DMSO/TMAO reductase YedYZ molybdopterin-dependent catalytic subunit
MSDHLSRRELLERGALAAVAATLGMEVLFARFAPRGWMPIAEAAESEAFGLTGTDGLQVLGDRPLNAQTPPHLLDDEITPASRLFIRNNGLIPDIAKQLDARNWTLTIDGEVRKPLLLKLDELRGRFKNHTYALVLECAGNGRAGYVPAAPGNQWTYGGVGCPSWTGVRLRDVLEAAELKPSAKYTGYYGHDLTLDKAPDKPPISRGTPIEKALDDYTLLAFEMNGKPIPAVHGFPVRLVCPGYPASVSGKWLKRIWIRDRVHDGPKMTGMAYRMPVHPVKPGAVVPESEMEIISKMPVKSLITFPRSGTSVPESGKGAVQVRGFAWTGEKEIDRVDVSYDFGQTWVKAKLKSPPNRYAWQRWEVALALPGRGYYEIWARATDDTGKAQPMVVPGWNPEGYLNNAMPRIALTVAG